MKTTSWDIKKRILDYNTAQVFLGDREYWVPTFESVQNFLSQDGISSRDYVIEKFDCDDFALLLHAAVRVYTLERDYLPWAFGEVWVPGHALNWVLLRECDCVPPVLRFIEPQFDRFVELEKGYLFKG